jgi:peptidyl-prolyl cis-trans isomerase B (cyclophilin B)
MRKIMLIVCLLAIAFVAHSGLALAQDEGTDSTKVDKTEEAPATEAEAAKDAPTGEEAVTEDSAKSGEEEAATDDAAPSGEEEAATEDAAKSGEEAVTEDAAKSGEEAVTEDAAKSGEEAATEDAAKSGDEEESVTEPTAVDPNAPYASVTFEEGEKPKVLMETSMGNITIELWPDLAPKHCQSMVYLIEKGFYDSLTFHRIVPGFVIQGGDPDGNGTGGPGYGVPAEFSSRPHEDGILSMARSSDPNSAGSQFFLCLGRLTSLDNKYTVFGKVTEGLDIIHKIEKVPTQSERPKTPVVMTKVSMIVDN